MSDWGCNLAKETMGPLGSLPVLMALAWRVLKSLGLPLHLGSGLVVLKLSPGSRSVDLEPTELALVLGSPSLMWKEEEWNRTWVPFLLLGCSRPP